MFRHSSGDLYRFKGLVRCLLSGPESLEGIFVITPQYGVCKVIMRVRISTPQSLRRGKSNVTTHSRSESRRLISSNI